MRGRLVIGLVTLVLLLAGVLWLATSALEELASKERLEALAGSLWGAPVEMGAVSITWLPPSLVASDLRALHPRNPAGVRAEAGEAAPLFEVARMELRPDLPSLIFGDAPRFRSLVLVAPVFRVALRDPFASPPPEPVASSSFGDDDAETGLRVEELRIEDGTLLFEGLPTPKTWRRIDELVVRAESAAGGFFRVEGEGVSDPVGLMHFAGRIHPDGRLEGALLAEKLELHLDSVPSAGDLLDLKGQLSLAAGGQVTWAGAVGRDATVDLRFDLKEVQVAPLGAFVSDAEALAGQATGRLVARGPLVRFDSLTADLVLDGAEFRNPDVELEGKVVARLELRGPATLPEGKFSLDARDARLRYRDIYRKPPGTAASLQGEVIADPEGRLLLANWKLRVEEFRAEVP